MRNVRDLKSHKIAELDPSLDDALVRISWILRTSRVARERQSLLLLGFGGCLRERMISRQSIRRTKTRTRARDVLRQIYAA